MLMTDFTSSYKIGKNLRVLRHKALKVTKEVSKSGNPSLKLQINHGNCGCNGEHHNFLLTLNSEVNNSNPTQIGEFNIDTSLKDTLRNIFKLISEKEITVIDSSDNLPILQISAPKLDLSF